MTDAGPQPPSSVNRGTVSLKPEDWNPEMAAASMAKDLINRMGTPAILSQKFVVWHGICKALNHIEPTGKDPGNETGIDCTYRLMLYDHVGKNSVNVDGKYFTAIWQYLMKPKYVITQPGQMPGNAFEEEQPPLYKRIINKITGGGKNDQPNNAQ